MRRCIRTGLPISLVLCLQGQAALAFGAQTVSFQQYDTTTATFTPLEYAGIQTITTSGDMVNTGPIYYPPSSTLPFVMLDTPRNLTLLHPGAFANVKTGVVVSVAVPAPGAYDVSGAFARASDVNGGDGVRVVVLINNNFATPLFDANISNYNVVNTNSVFSGTGVASFHFGVSLAQGDIIQFIVFSGPNLLDGTFDLTALQFNISGGGTNIGLPRDFPSSIIASGAEFDVNYAVSDPTPTAQSLPVDTRPSALSLKVAGTTASGGS